MTDCLRISRDTVGDILLEADDRVMLRLNDDEAEWLRLMLAILLDNVKHEPAAAIDDE